MKLNFSRFTGSIMLLLLATMTSAAEQPSTSTSAEEIGQQIEDLDGGIAGLGSLLGTNLGIYRNLNPRLQALFGGQWSSSKGAKYAWTSKHFLIPRKWFGFDGYKVSNVAVYTEPLDDRQREIVPLLRAAAQEAGRQRGCPVWRAVWRRLDQLVEGANETFQHWFLIFQFTGTKGDQVYVRVERTITGIHVSKVANVDVERAVGTMKGRTRVHERRSTLPVHERKSLPALLDEIDAIAHPHLNYNVLTRNCQHLCEQLWTWVFQTDANFPVIPVRRPFRNPAVDMNQQALLPTPTAPVASDIPTPDMNQQALHMIHMDGIETFHLEEALQNSASNNELH